MTHAYMSGSTRRCHSNGRISPVPGGSLRRDNWRASVSAGMYDANVVIAAFLMGMSFMGLLFAISEHLALRDAQREQYRES